MSDQAAADPLTRIRLACQEITAALREVDQANPAATVITGRMRGTVETVAYDLSELRYFTT